MTSGSSGSNSLEPPPLPPPDFTPISNEEWAKSRMPPLKGIIVDPEYPPTVAEARSALAHHERSFDATTDQARAAGQQPSDASIDPYRKSGTSDILGRAAATSENENALPGGTRHTAGGDKLAPEASVVGMLKSIGWDDFKGVVNEPCFRQAWLYGLPAGGLVGGALWILGKSRRKIYQWGFWSGYGVSNAVFLVCMNSTRTRKRNMAVVKETWEETRRDKKVQWEKYKEKQRTDKEKKVLEEQTKTTSWLSWASKDGKPRGREG
ncbi:hypothetical protein BT63DRAFT_428911 [Microthyrium microscopicum]|uniref:Cytochrome c oxidase assembly protein COX20, mitochondrial n=1 Tax=Microthyrium microscopicum TaxID=703497 RepID=A0A6A6TZW2_9PEZI|nr:hypothetical protein BT63DRAFT_428911 [Microthyrium microscopicum]